jgi:hypothetical protein
MTRPHARTISRGGLRADHGQAPRAGTKVPGHMWAAHPAPSPDAAPLTRYVKGPS